MDFAPSPRSQEWLQRLQRFMDDLVLPSMADWHRYADAGVHPLDVLEPLKAQARRAGLWNLCLPSLDDRQPGTRLSNLDYAALAEAMGRVPWSAEVFNCNAPDSGNMELLMRFANPAQREQWLDPLLAGTIRSCFAMSEPDVASSDPTQLETSLRPEGEHLVLNGRKWFITGATHPLCRLVMVMARHDGSGDAHRRHSIVLLPRDTPGLHIERNIPVMDHLAPEGHAELVLRNVIVHPDQILGEPGAGFALAQARLGPGRLHHGLRAIGQCELALELMCERALERRSFGARLADQANIQEWIARSRIEIDQARWLALHAAWCLDQDDPRATRGPIAALKVVTAQLQTQVLDRAIQVFGAMGLSPDTPLARAWAWGRALHLLDGPDEVHLRSLAREELRQAQTRRGANAAHLRRWCPPA
ncbi:MAG: acyl-CoA dehydrogenase family protein [Caldimonas sp.]|uniref:acyl-CoA dehydrogenase family protein n=1 Tax=Caldimonas sp. TaxID=2838790 RepID=UPI00391BC718